MSMQIRPAEARDAASLAALAIQVWLDTYAVDGVRDALARYVLGEFTEARFTGWIVDTERRLLVAESAGHLLGYAQVALAAACPDRPNCMTELETLYVQPGFQGQGVGRALLAAARALAPQGLWLSVWHRNEAAMHFYAAMGGERLGERYFELDGEKHLNWLFAWPGAAR